MYSFFNLFFGILLGLLYLNQMMTAVDSPKAKTLFNLITTKSSNLKQPFETSDGVLPSPLSREIPKSKLIQKGAKIQRRDIPFQETVVSLTKAKENEYVRPSADSDSDTVDKSLLPSTQVKVSGMIKPFVKPNETEAERAERIHRSFERLLTFVEIVGQVDNYVSSKWKNLVRTVSNFYDVEDEPYHVSSAKRLYGSCPHSH